MALEHAELDPVTVAEQDVGHLATPLVTGDIVADHYEHSRHSTTNGT